MMNLMPSAKHENPDSIQAAAPKKNSAGSG
jgi:hypothetical protein